MKPAQQWLLCAAVAGRLLAAPGAAGGGSIRLDGRLNEPAWKQARLVVELAQQSPRPGQPTPFRTEVRVLVGKEALYFGFQCQDPEPGKIAVHTMQRDASLEGDDTVSVVLDTHGDRRTGYFFQINAAGARRDGLIFDPEHPAPDWDGIWDARTARTESGWTAEIEIPVRTLNFTPGLKAWGLNLERIVARERITLRWAAPMLDAFLYDMSRAGELPGTEALTQGRGLEFTPYATGRMKDLFGRGPRTWQGAGGLDFTWRITPKLAAVFTGNTDFAETEVDARQVNLTRFPLFFPEKRAFFLEGSNQFEFGLGPGSDFIPFFSRRVGLLRGQQVPIDAGVKLNGRVGRWNLAMLDVRTRETNLAPATNLFAGRASYDVNQNLRVGALLTHGDPEGRKQNTLAGFDAVWRTSKFRGDKNLLVAGWTALSAGDLKEGRRSGWGLKIDYPNDLWDCKLILNEFGDALSPALGFLPRPGTRQSLTGCEYMPRPSKSGALRFLRQAFFEAEYSRVTNLRGINESWNAQLVPLKVQFESGDALEFQWAPQYEWLPGPFEIVEGLAILPGAYRFTRWNLEAQTSPHRPVQAGSTTGLGRFYNGHLTQWENYLRWTSPRGRYRAGLTVEQNFGHLKEGSFVQRLWQLETAFAWSPNLVLTSFIQFDSESQNLGTNTRLRWTLKPGRELFFVWNRGWQRLRTSRNDLLLAPDSEFLAVKMRWTFRR